MKIRYITNNIEDHVDRNLGASLIRAGIAVAVEEPPREAQFNPISRRDDDMPICGESHQDRARRRLGLSAPTAPAVPVWDVLTIPRPSPTDPARKELVIQMELLGGTYRWSGDPKSANLSADWDNSKRHLNGFGRPIPEDILKRYTALWKKEEKWRGPTSSKLSYNATMLAASLITGGDGGN